MTIQAKPIFTEAGINHAINTNANGVAFQITHISFGDSKFDPTGTETSLPNERLRVPISSSTRINDNTFKVSAKVKSPTTDSFFCQSIGFWSNETLFALYSSNANSSDGLFAIHHNVEVLASYVLGLDRLATDEFKIIVGGDQDKLSQMLSVSENNFYEQLQNLKKALEAQLNAKWEELQAKNSAQDKKILDGAPPGSMISYAGQTAPEGWLICDGSRLKKSLYPELYAAIGDIYGADETTFNIPDSRYRYPRAAGPTLAVGTKQEDAIKTHSHYQATWAGMEHTIPVDKAGQTIYEVPSSEQSYGGNKFFITQYDYWPRVPVSETGGEETRPLTNVELRIIKY